MPVVINEFEVVDTPPATRGTGDDPSAAPPAAAPLEPEDLRQMLAVSAELQLRRFSH